jgi:hypothetical protein
MDCLSLLELYDRNQEGGLLYWRPRKIYKRRFWRWAPLSIGDPLGKLEGRFVYWGVRETVKEGSGNGSDRLSVWGLCEGNLEGWHLYWGY